MPTICRGLIQRHDPGQTAGSAQPADRFQSFKLGFLVSGFVSAQGAFRNTVPLGSLPPKLSPLRRIQAFANQRRNHLKPLQSRLVLPSGDFFGFHTGIPPFGEHPICMDAGQQNKVGAAGLAPQRMKGLQPAAGIVDSPQQYRQPVIHGTHHGIEQGNRGIQQFLTVLQQPVTH